MNLYANLGTHSGYGVWSLHTVNGLRKALATKGIVFEEYFNIVNKSVEGLKDNLLKREISTSSFLSNDSLALLPASAVPNIYGKNITLFPMHEGTIIPERERHLYRSVDKVVASCSFLKDVFSQYVDESKIELVHAGIDTDINKRVSPKRDPRIVFTVVGKYENRKATEETLLAFLKYFNNHPERDNVVLKLKILTNTFSRGLHEIKNNIKYSLLTYPLAAERVVILDFPSIDMPALYHETSCLLMPSRSEGIGLGVLEAYAYEVPVIATTYGAFKDYVNTDATFTLPDRRLVPIKDSFYGLAEESHGQWGDVRVDDIVEQIDLFMNTPESTLKEMTSANRKWVVDNFNNVTQAHKLLGVLENGYNRIKDQGARE